MNRYLFYPTLLLSVMLSNVTLAANPEAAKNTATSICANCHGPKGISSSGMFPNLAGQKEEYLVNALKAYREKTRNLAIMNNMAASLTDEDIANLAAYFSALKPCE